jgi:hypothetical protein
MSHVEEVREAVRAVNGSPACAGINAGIDVLAPMVGTDPVAPRTPPDPPRPARRQRSRRQHADLDLAPPGQHRDRERPRPADAC